MIDKPKIPETETNEEATTKNTGSVNKGIVVCCDGTNAEYRKDNTNVVKIFEAIERNDSQVAFYDPGVGTFSIFGRTVGRWFGIFLGLAFGYGIRKNVEDGYEYLMGKYEPGDKVYIFGFSRGAYTARALAGMICGYGILHKDRKNLIPYVSKMYFKRDWRSLRYYVSMMLFEKDRVEKEKERKKEKDEVREGFKTLFSQCCVPYFVGVWDTVGALGPNLSKRFHNNVLDANIKFGYHAISIDERRWTYKVRCWDESRKPEGQIIEQVWFPGGHSDIGGGCRNDERELSDISLGWIIDKARDCGLILREDWKDKIRLRQSSRGKMHNGWKVWLLYIVPTIRRIPDGARMFPLVRWLWSTVLKQWRIKHRLEVQPRVHQSVIDRMGSDTGYHPVLPERYTRAVTASYPEKSDHQTKP